jgi:hypothetical protein
VERSRVTDYNPHLAPKAQAPQRRAFTLEIFHGVIPPDFRGIQKPIEWKGGPALLFAFLAFFPFWNFACTTLTRLDLQVYY